MQWISVEERLPEDGRCVLISWENGICAIAARKGGWWSNQWNSSVWSKSEAITHWQPLPDPPKKPGPFHVLAGDLACPADRVYHSETSREICQLLDADLARRICDTLNELWALQGTTEDHNDRTTNTSAMGGGTAGSTTCSRDRCANQ